MASGSEYPVSLLRRRRHWGVFGQKTVSMELLVRWYQCGTLTPSLPQS